MATIIGQNLQNDLYSKCWLSQRIQIFNSDLQVLKGTIFPTFYAVLVKIGPLTPEIT